MAVEAIPDVLENGINPLQMMEAAGVVMGDEQQPSLCDIQVGLSTKHLEEKGVQEMLRIFKVTEIPDYYVKPPHQRQQRESPKETELKNLTSIPVVDLAAPFEELVAAIGRACEYGFYQIINHGTPPELIMKITSQAEEFFALPAEEKVKSSTNKKVVGPVHFGGGSRGDWRDVLKLHCAPLSDVAMEFWPRQPEGFRDTIVQYATQKQILVRRLLELISESLGLDKGYIDAECGDPRVLIAMNFYPPCPEPSLTIGIREHSDPNTITILLQDEVQGLQVCKDGLWIDVKPIDGALVVNSGDHLQILSNGRYPSCLHRVVTNKWQSRMSIATFYSPSKTSCIKPAPPLLDDENPAVFREFIYSDFLKDFYLNGGPNNKVILSQFQMPKTELS